MNKCPTLIKMAKDTNYVYDFMAGIEPSGTYTINSAMSNKEHHWAHRTAGFIGGMIGGSALLPGAINMLAIGVPRAIGSKAKLPAIAKELVKSLYAPYEELYHGVKALKELKNIRSGVSDSERYIQKTIDTVRLGAAKKSMGHLTTPVSLGNSTGGKLIRETIANGGNLAPVIKNNDVAHDVLKREVKRGVGEGIGLLGLSGAVNALSTMAQYETGKKTQKLLNAKTAADKSDKTFYHDPLVYVGAGGAAAGVKLNKDINKVLEGLDKWEAGMIPYADLAQKGKLDLRHSIKAINTYNRGARDLSQQRVLGIKAGKIMQHGRNALERTGRIVELQKKKFIKNYHPYIPTDDTINKIVNHYKLYSNGESDEILIKHMVEKGISDLRLSDTGLKSAIKTDKNISAPIEAALLSREPVYKRMMRLKHEYPDAFEAFKKVMSGGNDNPGEAKMLAGDNARYVSVPKIYKENLKPILNGIKRATPYMVLGGAGYAGVRVISDLPRTEKKASDDHTKNTAITVLGGAAVLKGLHTKQNKNIGVTYGTMPTIGEGHSSPGRAIKKIIENDARFKDYTVDALERTREGVYVGPGKDYNMLIDTGFGVYIPHPALDATHQTHGEKIPTNTKYKTKVNYLTDAIPASGGRGAVAPPRVGKAPHIAFGPYLDRMDRNDHARFITTGSNMTPALDPDIAHEIATTNYDRDKILSEISDYIGTTDMDDISKQKIVNGITELKGKKIITISGSGRGDYVQARARQLSDALNKAGLSNEYGILALSAGSKGGPKSKLIEGTGVVEVGRLPKNLFVGAQNIADMHWGSTGTSSLMESVLSRNPQLLQKEWGGRNDISKIPKGTIADYQEMLLKDHEPYKTLYGNNRHAEIDYWNKGNREMMRNMPGVAEVSNSDEVVEILKDNKRLEELKSQSKMRQEINYKGYKGQVDNTVNELYRIAKANNTRAMAKRIALLSGGIAASGYGINKLVSVGRRDNASA